MRSAARALAHRHQPAQHNFIPIFAETKRSACKAISGGQPDRLTAHSAVRLLRELARS